MADFVDEKLREMESRLKELRPLVDEYHRLGARRRRRDRRPPRREAGVGRPAPQAHRAQALGLRQARPAEGQRPARQAGAGDRPRQARDHDPGDRRRDPESPPAPARRARAQVRARDRGRGREPPAPRRRGAGVDAARGPRLERRGRGWRGGGRGERTPREHRARPSTAALQGSGSDGTSGPRAPGP